VGLAPGSRGVVHGEWLGEKDESGFFIDATLNAELSGVAQAEAEALVAKAHTICPYSKATRGNIRVKLQANGRSVTERATHA